MDRIFAVLKNKYPGCIFVYMDDILIVTPDDEELQIGRASCRERVCYAV